MKKKQKSIAQVAYEKNPIGGIANFGAWDTAPECVRESHRNLCDTAIKEFINRGKKNVR